MNKQFYISILSVLAAWPCVAHAEETNSWGTETNHVQMSISLECGGAGSNYLNRNFIPREAVTTIKKGAYSSLIVRFKTTSTNEHFFGWCSMGMEINPRTGFGLKVVSTSGRDISPPVTGENSGGGSGMGFFCSPNRIEAIHWPMGTVYKLNKVGTYKIIATRMISKIEKPSNEFIVVSNPLLVNVIP